MKPLIAILLGLTAAASFARATIPGATHLGWREVLGRLDEIPTDAKVIPFRNKGAPLAQAAFGLQVLDRDNVLVLQTGHHGWLEIAAHLL